MRDISKFRLLIQVSEGAGKMIKCLVGICHVSHLLLFISLVLLFRELSWNFP